MEHPQPHQLQHLHATEPTTDQLAMQQQISTHSASQEPQYHAYLAEPPFNNDSASTSGVGAGTAGGSALQTQPSPYRAAMGSLHHQLAFQYHQPRQDDMTPISHLPLHYQVTSPADTLQHNRSASVQQEQHIHLDPALSQYSHPPTEPLQKVLTWQNGVSYALVKEQQFSKASIDPADYAISEAPLGEASGSTQGPTRPRSFTIPRANPPAVSDVIAVAPSTLVPSAPSSHFDFTTHIPSTANATTYQALQFQVPPQAKATVALSQPLPSPMNAPRTIDLNPSANAARQQSMSSAPSRAQRSDSSASLQMQPHPLAQQLFPFDNSSSPNHTFRNLRAADWDETGSPMRIPHARFQSASNVRGAPTEAVDGTPAKLMWDQHGRMATLESITSSQWSPVVKDMYRLVDPLQMNFDFTSTWDQGIASPAKAISSLQQQQPVPGQSGRRMSSFSSIASGHVASPPPLPSFVQPALQVHQPQPSLHQHTLSSGGFYQPISSNQYGQSPYQQPHMQSERTVQQHIPVRPQHAQAAHLQQHLSMDEDAESRRASTSTSASSIPLVSPPDLQAERPTIAHQMQGGVGAPSAHIQFQDPMSRYLQEPDKRYTYRDYFTDPYDPSPPTMSQCLPHVDNDGSQSSALSAAGISPGPPAMAYPVDWHVLPPVELPIAQLERQTLKETPQQAAVPKDEVKRKRMPSRRDSTSKLQPLKPSLGERSRSANETLAPAQERAYRRLSSPVLSVRPSDVGEADTLLDDDDDDDDEDDNHLGEDTSTDRSQPGSVGVQYGSLPTPGFLGPPTIPNASGLSAPVPSVYGSLPSVSSSSASTSAYATPVAENQPAHPVPPPPDTSQLVRVVPNSQEDPELGAPRRQKLRFAGDWYTPEWVRGDSAKKEGFCDLCQPGKWLQLKNSAFWYHRQYTHGISSVSEQPFSTPVTFRQAENDASTEALCHQCNEWVMYTSKKQNSTEEPSLRIPTNWFKHAHKCHFYVANRSKTEKPRGKRRKVSSSPDDE